MTVSAGFHPRYRDNYRHDGYNGYSGGWRGPRRGALLFTLSCSDFGGWETDIVQLLLWYPYRPILTLISCGKVNKLVNSQMECNFLLQISMPPGKTLEFPEKVLENDSDHRKS